MFELMDTSGKIAKRSENWTERETNLLLKLMKDKIQVIESKSTSSKTISQKREAWKEIWKKFVVENERPRTLKHLHLKWKNLRAKQLEQKRKQFNISNATADVKVFAEPLSTEDPLTTEECSASGDDNAYQGTSNTEYPEVPIVNKRTKNLVSRVHESKKGVEFKKSLLSLNKLVKEQITNCALEEHSVRMKQLSEEHDTKMEMAKQLHSLECDNKRLQAQLLGVEIEIKKKILTGMTEKDYMQRE